MSLSPNQGRSDSDNGLSKDSGNHDEQDNHDYLQNIISDALQQAQEGANNECEREGHQVENSGVDEYDNDDTSHPEEGCSYSKDQDADYLRNVLAAAFNVINGDEENNQHYDDGGNAKGKSSSQEHHHAEDHTISSQQMSRDPQDHDFDLQNAIGEAFKNIEGHDMKSNSGDEQNDMGLDNLIGEALKNIHNDDNEPIDDSQMEHQQSSENAELDLQDAINDALKGFQKEDFGSDNQQKEMNIKEYDSDFVPVQDAAQNNFDKESNVRAEDEVDHDHEQDLQDAIGEAFKNLESSHIDGHDLESQTTSQGQDVDHELDLQNAIGEALVDIRSSAMLDDNNQQVQSHNISEVQHVDEQEDSNLHDAIGEALKNIQKSGLIKSQHTTEKKDIGHESDEESNLQDAIGEAFKDIQNLEGQRFGDQTQDTERNDKVTHEHELGLQDVIGEAFESIHNHDTDSLTKNPTEANLGYQDKESDALDDAIGDAFKEISNHYSAQPDSEVNELSNAISDAFKEITPQPSSKENENSEDHGIDLAAVIGDALNAAMVREMEKPSNHDDNDQQMSDVDNNDNENMEEAIQNALRATFTNNDNHRVDDSNSSEHHEQIDVSNVVQNIISQMSEENHFVTTSNQNQISEEVLHNLAHELTTKIQNEDYRRNQHLDNDYELHTGSGEINEHQRFLEAETGLNQNELDQILQNAFALAMGHPQEDHDQYQQVDTTASDYENNLVEQPKKSKSKKLTSSSSSHHMDDQLPKKKKALSIAETLALSRSSMKSAPLRDYSSIESINDVLRTEKSKPSRSVPLGSLDSSLNISSKSSAHGSTGIGSEKNLVSAIKSMTDALLKTKLDKTTNVPQTSQENMISSLVLAKQFLFQRDEGDTRNGNLSNDAIKIIEDALNFCKKDVNNVDSRIIDADNSDPNIDTALKELNMNHRDEKVNDDSSVNDILLDGLSPNTISSISLAVSNALSNFKKHTKSSTPPIKPKPDIPEIKEKIRFDNRERKKKWREENSERNKDNDLRCRVQKRANGLFGDQDSEEKRIWSDNEFKKRRDKRLSKKKSDPNSLIDSMDLGDSKNQDRESFDGGNPNDIKSEIMEVDAGNDLSNDASFVKSVTNIFNIFSSSNKSDTTSAITATATATAATAAVYSSQNGIDMNEIISAITSIIQKLLSNTPESSVDNVAGVPKGTISSFKVRTNLNQNKNLVPAPPSKFPDAELTSLVQNKNSSLHKTIRRISSPLNTYVTSGSGSNDHNPILELQRLSIGNFTTSTGIGIMSKRRNDDFSDAERSKRPRSVSPPAFKELRNNRPEKTTEDANIDPEISKNSSSASALGFLSNFKLPQYKRPELDGNESVSNATPSTTHQEDINNTSKVSKDSPNSNSNSGVSSSTAISANVAKMYSTVTASKPNANASPVSKEPAKEPSAKSQPLVKLAENSVLGLRKPGTFQRPSYSKPKDRSKSLGFPRLLSSSFKN